MVKHYITKYTEIKSGKETRYAESWIQLNIFGQVYCFNKKRIKI